MSDNDPRRVKTYQNPQCYIYIRVIEVLFLQREGLGADVCLDFLSFEVFVYP